MVLYFLFEYFKFLYSICKYVYVYRTYIEQACWWCDLILCAAIAVHSFKKKTPASSKQYFVNLVFQIFLTKYSKIKLRLNLVEGNLLFCELNFCFNHKRDLSSLCLSADLFFFFANTKPTNKVDKMDWNILIDF